MRREGMPAGAALAVAAALALVGLSQVTPAQAQSAPPPPKAPSARPATPGTIGLPHTLAQALAATYSYQPALQAERAKLRATDEGVPTALAGWRPTVILGGGVGYGDGVNRAYSEVLGQYQKTQTGRDLAQATATVTQPLYTGGKVQANLNHAKNADMAERANLIVAEEQSFTDTVNAYVGVIQAQQLLALNVNNEQVLAKQLQATNDRFRVGEITRTDVAQAEAALAGATAARETAEGNLQTARATYRRVIGFDAPANLVEPQPLRLPVKTEQEAAALAAANNPTVIVALFNDAAAKDAIDVAFAALMPQVSLQGQMFQQNNTGARSDQANGYLVTANVSMPIYQGGSEYSAVRQARQSRAAGGQAGRRRPPDRGAECGRGLGHAGRRAGVGREHAGGDPRQRDRAGRRRARGDRRQPHHARRAECAAGAAELADPAGAEPGAVDHGVVRRRRGDRPADRAGSEPAGAAVRRHRVLQRGARTGGLGWATTPPTSRAADALGARQPSA